MACIFYVHIERELMVAITRRLFKGLLIAMIGFFSSSGCMYLGVGAIGAVGGYIVSPDTVEGVLNAEYKAVWQAASEKIHKRGTVITEDETGGRITADADGTEIIVQIVPAETRGSWKVSVKARRNMFPKIRLAQLIYTDIHDAVLK